MDQSVTEQDPRLSAAPSLNIGEDCFFTAASLAEDVYFSAPSSLTVGEDRFFTPASLAEDVYFSAEEFWEDETIHGLSNFEQKLFNVNMCEDEYWQGPGIDQCLRGSGCHAYAGMCSPTCVFETMYEAEIEPHDTKNSPSANTLNLFLPAQASAHVNQGIKHPSPVFISPVFSSSPWIQTGHPPLMAASLIQANEPWAYANNYVWNHSEPINCVNMSDPKVCMFQNECDAPGAKNAAIYYNQECNTLSSGNNFFEGQPSSLTAITSSTSDEDEAMSIDNECSPRLAGESPAVQQNLEPSNHEMASSSQTAKSEQHVCFMVMNGTLEMSDGYTWRKYGQKKIKEKNHPRAYFRCAQPGCSVKKQVEKSSDEEDAMLITYINRHNHCQ